MARAKTWREKATSQEILKVVTRKNSPITTYVGLAKKFGAPVSEGWYSNSPAASPSFRQHVRGQLGDEPRRVAALYS